MYSKSDTQALVRFLSLVVFVVVAYLAVTLLIDQVWLGSTSMEVLKYFGAGQ